MSLYGIFKLLLYYIVAFPSVEPETEVRTVELVWGVRIAVPRVALVTCTYIFIAIDLHIQHIEPSVPHRDRDGKLSYPMLSLKRKNLHMAVLAVHSGS